jgi:hypothetical protein
MSAMTDRDAFLTWVTTVLHDAEVARSFANCTAYRFEVLA